MRLWVALSLALMFGCFVPATSWAQNAVPPAVTPRATPNATPSTTQLTDRERALVRQAVANVGDSYQRSRTAAGLGNIVGGVLVGGLGMYLYLSQDDPSVRLIGVAIAFSSVPQLVSGMWNIFYHTSQEDMADKILTSDALVDGGGLLFVEQEARRAKRNRLVGGTTSLVQGGATIATYFLLKKFFVTGPDNILLIFFAVGTAIQVIQGVITLVGKSGPERAYADLLDAMGRNPTAPKDDNRISRLRVAPTLMASDGKLAPGLGLSFGF